MKKIILFAILGAFCAVAKAQSDNFHAFKVDVSLGYAIPTDGGGTKAGATFTVQPHYRLTDDFAVGLRIEDAAIGYENSQTGNIKISVLGSYCGTAEYYFMDDSFRPFAGIGAGLFVQASAQANSNDNTSVVSGETTGFGGFPEVGFELGHLRVALAYNIVSNNDSYAAIQIGAFFGGGRK